MEERKTINKDLFRERNNASFDSEHLAGTLYGKDRLKRKRYIENLALSCREFEGPYYGFLSLEERYAEGVRAETLLAKAIKKYNLTDPTDIAVFSGVVLQMDGSALALHRIAFVPPILSQGSPEQVAKWKPLIDSFQMLGSYAQTELGHGSNVRALETTAVYDPKTEEFVLNSPSLTSMKWWPGNLGKTCNHTLVLAQLYSKGKKLGLQAFLLQVRDMTTHQPLPGITLGDIGPTYGGTATDNGFMILKNVRIPRFNMLSKFAKIEADGSFIKPENDKVTYSGMMEIRCSLPKSVAKILAMGSTIATRYSLVRRQSEMKPGAPEPQVLDYQTQQYKVLPAVCMAYAFWFVCDRLYLHLRAAPEPQVLDYQTQQYKVLPTVCMAYAFWFVGDWLLERFRAFREDMKRNKFDAMLPLHAASSGMKAYTSAETSNMLELCRLACGGHGYSLASGFHRLFTNAAGVVTAEGECTVLHLQAARYLMKAGMNAAQGKKLDPTVAYLTHGTQGRFQYTGEVDLPNLLKAFQYKATRCIERAGARLQKLMAGGMDMHDAMNNSAVYLVEASKAHAEVLIMQSFIDRMTSLRGDAMAQPVGLMGGIYFLYLIDRNPGPFLEGGWMSDSQLDFVREKLVQLLERMRVDAVAYVDSFDFLDRQLQSELGRYDGDVYENMYKWATSAPLNKTEVHESFDKYLKPMRLETKAKL